MEPETTLFVVDDDSAVAAAVSELGEMIGLNTESFAFAQDFLDAFDETRPGCLVLDVRMRGMSGIQLQKWLTERQIDIPTIVISGHADVRMAVEAMRAGAVTFLEKPFRMQELIDHIHEAVERDNANRRRREIQAAAKQRLSVLTDKEREVFDLVAAGNTNAEIAEELGLSSRAIEDRRARLLKKLQLESLAEVIELSKTVTKA